MCFFDIAEVFDNNGELVIAAALLVG